MSYFEYTDYAEPSSSLVDGVYFNANTNQIALDLNDSVYVYKNVDEADFVKFRTEPSAGRYYNTEFKVKHGPGDYLEDYGYVDFEPVVKNKVADAGTPKDLSKPTKEYSLNINDANAPFGTVETVGATKEYSLKTPAPVVRASESGDYKVEVIYSLKGYDTEYNFTTEADDVSDALDELSDNLKVMGLTGKALRAVVHFE